MIKRKRSINSIIHDQLLGYASEEDKKQLQSWLDSSQENRENYDRLMREACLIDRYKQFAQVDEARAWERFQKKHFSIRSARWIKIGRYAAIFLLPIIGFAIWFWTLRLMDSQPVISDEVRIAMIRSEKMGKQKATLVLANGQKMDLKSVPAKPLQDSVEQVTVAQPSVPETDVNESEEVSVVENNKLSTYDDSEFWMTFEDGTRVHLNYNTTLKYPPHFGTTTRTVYLDGEAYFQVAKDSKRPFRVITANGVVKQYGTTFNVNTHVPGITKVVLVKGSVSVLPNQGGEYKIKPGELAVLQADTQDVQISVVDIEPYIAWNSGRFVFDNCSLESLMNVISRWYNKDVVFESEDTKKIRFTGDIGSLRLNRAHIESDTAGDSSGNGNTGEDHNYKEINILTTIKKGGRHAKKENSRTHYHVSLYYFLVVYTGVGCIAI